MPDNRGKALLTDIGTEELGHLEIIGSIVGQLTDGEGAKSFDKYGNADYYVDHGNAVYPANAAGVPFTAAYLQSKADPISDIMEDLAAEQKARATYDNILRLSDDPDVNEVIKFLRAREVVHFHAAEVSSLHRENKYRLSYQPPRPIPVQEKNSVQNR